MNFVHLATRSDMSVTTRPAIEDYPGCARVDQFVHVAKSLGQPAIGFTELGSMRGAYLQTIECAKQGIKPIYGIEVYVCADMHLQQMPKEERERVQQDRSADEWREAVDHEAELAGYTQSERDLTTLNLWAIDDRGLKNLFAISSLAWIEGYYYKPRVDLALLAKYCEGVACGTGGPNSFVMRPLVEGKRGLALERANSLAQIFGDRLYAEVRPHKLVKQAKANRFAVDLFARGTAKLLATQLPHYLTLGDLPQQKMLTAIVSGKGSDVESAGLPIDNYWFKDGGSMLASLTACKIDPALAERACLETVKFAELCTAKLEINPFAMIMPNVDTGELSHQDHLRYIATDSKVWERIYQRCESEQALRGEYHRRFEHELSELARPVSEGSEVTFASYIVYVHEVVTMARELGIALGPGRGSSAGSLVNYLIGITDVDPIEHGLSFARFIDPNRIGPPDIDIDCDPSQRQKLIDAMRARWGEHCVASIATLGKLKGRRVAEDVCRELRIPIPEMRKVTRWIEQRSDDDKGALEAIKDAFTGPGVHEDCVRFIRKYPEFLEHAAKLEGLARSVGVHPAGIVAAPCPLWEITPLEVRKPDKDSDRVLVTAFEMKAVDQVGLLKIDMLGLITITTIEHAFNAINSQLPNESDHVSWGSIRLDDQATLDAFSAGDLSGVFQLDSASGRRLCRGVTFKKFSVIADFLAVNRPGPLDSGMAEEYLARIKGEKEVQIDYCPEVSELTSDTFGVMLYQEQVMAIAEKIGKHKNPDALRKVMGKKLVTKIEVEREPFLDGATQTTSMTREQANKLFDDMATFAEYGFNRSHSVAYAKIAYVCQWLKVHYPLEFYWALLLTSKDKTRPKYARDAIAHGVKLSTPSVQSSGNSLAIDRSNGSIVGALSDIKGVGSKAADAIMAAQPFASFADFMERTERQAVNAGAIKALARAGAFDSLISNVRWFVEHCDELMHESKLKRFKGWETALAPGEDAPRWSNAERLFEATQVNPMALESPYTEILAKLAIELIDVEDPSSIAEFDGQPVWLTGTLIDVKTFPNTPYGESKLSEAEMEHESYLAQQANASILTENGTQLRCKAAWHVYRNCVDSFKDGEQVLMLATVDLEYNVLRVIRVVPLQPFATGEGKTIWHNIVQGQHPIDTYQLSNYDSKLVKANTAALIDGLHSGKFEQLDLLGVVTDIKTKLAGRDKTEMAWIGVLSRDLVYSVVTVFSSDWIGGFDRYRKQNKIGCREHVSVGTCVRMSVKSDEFQGRNTLQAFKVGSMK